MKNPQYKFFQDDLANHEVPRYSDGSVIEFKPSTPELKLGADRIIRELEARGYRRMRGQNWNSISFSKPEYCKAAYIGTTVNRFSLLEKVWHWSDQFAISEKYIHIHEVYRKNGAANNASFVLSVCARNSDKAPEWYNSRVNSSSPVNKYGVEIPTSIACIAHRNAAVTQTIVRKFKPDISDKVLMKILDSAENLIKEYTLFDPICWEADATNFPKDNSAEYNAYRKEQAC